MHTLDTSRYANLHDAHAELSEEYKRRSWLLKTEYPPERQGLVLASIENVLSRITNYPGYQVAVANLLQAPTWDEYQEQWWTLKVAFHIAERGFLREMEIELPNGRVPDMMGEVLLEGQPSPFYVECKSWRFHPAPEANISCSDLPLDERVERMKQKLLKQLPEDSLGVWAWDKMRDVISGSHTPGSNDLRVGAEERQVIKEVSGAVPQLAAVMVKALDEDLSQIIWTVPTDSSTWPQSRVAPLVAMLNSATP